MRISDWSSDVCSSDLQIIAEVFGARALFPLIFAIVAIGIAIANFSNAAIVERFGARRVSQSAVFAFMADRQSVVEGKRVSVRVDIGGRRIIKKNNNTSTYDSV